jgi:molecular chaperone GrpE
MIQRTLFGSSRAVGLGARAYRASFPHTSSPSPLIQALASRRQIHTSRRYSSTTEPSKEAQGEISSTEGQIAGQKEEDPLKKQLEAKNKEVIDLKVRFLRLCL